MSYNLKYKIYKKMQDSTIASFSTITPEKLPWVRYVTVSADEDLTIWFSTFVTSRKIGHIKKNNKVHLVLGVTDMQTAKSYIQVQGVAEILEDGNSRERVWSDALKGHFSGVNDPNMRACRVRPYRIEYNNMNPANPSEIWVP